MCFEVRSWEKEGLHSSAENEVVSISDKAVLSFWETARPFEEKEAWSPAQEMSC